MKHITILILIALLAACAAPTALAPATSAPVPAQVTPTLSALASVPAPAVAYHGDDARSVTVQAGDVVTIHNPDFSRGYTFTIVQISANGITVTTNEPNVTIRNNGGAMPSFIHATESYATGYELPIDWARFTPLEHTAVVQTYSMQPGGTVVREGDQN